MILDVFNLDLFSRVKELSMSLDDSYYTIKVKLNNGKWTFLVYYIQENKFNNILQYKKFLNDFECCLYMMD